MRPDYEFSYEQYASSPGAENLTSWIFGRGHELLETSLPRADAGRVLEVGAGTGNHIQYLRHGFKEYVITDLQDTLMMSGHEEYAPGVSFRKMDAGNLEVADSSIDRLISCHVLEHLPKPHRCLREWHRVVRGGGIISILLPTDPGLAWRLARIFARKSAHKQGIPYDYVISREHINPFNNLLAFVRYYFEEMDEYWWPSKIPMMDINLFYCCHIHVQK